MNLRKAQKHMQRARELLNQEGQLGFGVETRAQKKRKRELDQIFETDEQLEKKIREHVENREYRALQNMIDTVAHSSEHKKWMTEKMDKLKSGGDLRNFMTLWLNDYDALERMKKKMFDEKVKNSEFQESLFLEIATEHVKNVVKYELGNGARRLVQSNLPESLDELKQMILARGIFESAAVEILNSMNKNKSGGYFQRRLADLSPGENLRTGPDHNLFRKKLALLNLNEDHKKINDEVKKRRKERRQDREFASGSELSDAETEIDNEPF